MVNLVIYQLKKRLPIISILLVISCLLSSLPQFILGNIYNDITGQVISTKTFYLFTLSAFTHSPDILMVHLIGNIIVILVYGVLTEIIIGSEKFAMISIITFLSTITINYLHTANKYIGHGVSGIVWGYHIFYIFILIILYECNGRNLFKNISIILGVLLLLFDIVGIPIAEVIILNKKFFSNFGQVLHLISMLVVVPFIFLWRKDIELNIKKLISKENIVKSINYKNKSVRLLLLLLLLNIYGTCKAIILTVSRNYSLSYNIIPELETRIDKIPQKIVVNFNKEIQSSKNVLTSIDYNEKLKKLEISNKIEGLNTLSINFNRKFVDGEKIKLVYLIIRKTEDGVVIQNKVSLEYQ